MTAPWRLVGWRRGCAGLHFPALSIFMAGLLAAVAARGGEPAFDEIERVPGFLKGTSPPSAAEVDTAIRKGVEFLLKVQEKDGSWGSPRNTKGLNIYAPVPGAHHAFRAADTALCYAALFEVGGDAEDVRRALDRAEVWMEMHLPLLRRATPDAIYNSWGHAYGIQGLVRMHKRHAGDGARQAKIRDLIRGQIDLLARYESVDGGWGYYDFSVGAQKPVAVTTSFTTATALVAFHEAKEVGVEPPELLVRRAVATLHRQQKPDFTYVYSERHKWRPMYYISRTGGSVGRSQACNIALRYCGDPKITDEVLRTWLEKLFTRNLWLDMGRKRPIPHESWFLVAGYFFYYGHYYAALCIDALPPEARPRFQVELAWILVRLQEKDGSWWDYPFYDYHQQYGTAFALMSLRRCQRPVARDL